MTESQPVLFSTPPDVTGAGYVESFELIRDKVGDWAEHPFNVPCVANLHERVELHPAVTFFVGENGSGKSTLLEALAIKLGFSAEGGSKNYRFSTRDTHSTLHQHLRITRRPGREKDHFFLRAESFYTLMTKLEEYETGGFYLPYSNWGNRVPHERSHGEAFLSMLMNRLGGKGLYVFDEPEAALSPKRQMSALIRMHDLVMQRSQFIIATHSPILLAYPHATIYECSENGLKRVKYEDTEIFQVTRDFLNRHEKMVPMLLQPPEVDGANH